MGGAKRWGWGDDDSRSAAAAEDGDGGQWCATRRIVESNCKTEEVEAGRFIRKCDKTEKILRDCVGKPTEVVESITEHSEEDVTDEVTNGSVPFGGTFQFPGTRDGFSTGTFTFPGTRDGFEAIERGIRSDYEAIERSFSHIMDAADEMVDGFFRSFRIPFPKGDTESSPFGHGRPADKLPDGETSKMDDSAYTEYAAEIRDV